MARLHRVHESADAVRPRALRPAAALLTMGLLLTGCAGADGEQTEDGQSAAASTAQDGGATASTTGGAEAGGSQDTVAESQGEGAPSVDPADFPASNTTGLTRMETLKGTGVVPKSVVSNQHGLMITNNVTYRHNVVLFDTETREVVQALDDTVDTDAMGIEGLSGVVSGAPVEAA